MNEILCADQSEVFAFLADPATHGLKEPVLRIDTHGAAVFLAGQDVYKVKRAVRFPFMDFSSLDKRRTACERELAVNKVNAPDLYLGVVPVSKAGSHLKLGAGGTIVEWAVHLRRFDENRTLDRLATRGELSLGITAKVAGIVEASHRRAQIAAGANATSGLEQQIEETLTSLEAAPQVFAPHAVAGLRAAMQLAFARGKPLLLERETQGEVRRCHGDLHLRNIALIKDQPVLFDAIEFDETFATCDVLYDLAFLLMDLWTRGLKRHANLILNRYLWVCMDVEREIKGFSLLPLFLSMRAAIRAKVAVLQPGADHHEAEARRHFQAACAFLVPARLDLAAIGGLSGTGKSSIATMLAARIGRAPGAVHLRSDIERKRLHGARELDRLPPEAYRPETAARTYERLRSLASTALAAGQSAVVDAVHLRPQERAAIERIARQNGARFTGLWLEAPLDVLKERVANRLRDASDATAGVVSLQAKQAVGVMDWLRLDASAPPESVAARALAAIMR
jgi:aminoglycoside phosphotransferase family enzyme/predicted kinase